MDTKIKPDAKYVPFYDPYRHRFIKNEKKMMNRVSRLGEKSPLGQILKVIGNI